MELTNRQRKNLRESLLAAFPSRGELKIMLSEELNITFDQIAEGENYREEVFNLIQYFDSQGKIKKLIDAAMRSNPTNPDLNKFFNYYSSPITETEVDKLKSILDRININLVKSAYQQTLPSGATVDNPRFKLTESIDDIIQFLCENYPKSTSGIPSLIEFAKQVVDKLVKKSDSSLDEYEDLVIWLKDITARLNLNVPIPSHGYKTSEEQNSYLLIVINPEGNQFRIAAEFILDEKHKSQPEPLNLQEIFLNEEGNKQECDYRTGILYECWDKIPELLEKIIRGFISNFQDDILYLTVEVFLPYKYLSHNLDETWRIQDDFGDLIPIIQEFNMIVHPIDRFIGPFLFRNLKEGWDRLLHVIELNPCQDILLEKIESVHPTENLNWKQLTNNLKNSIGLKSTSSVSENSQDIFFKTILSGGIPFAFWTRCQAPPELKLEHIDCHLTVDCLKNNLQRLIAEIWNIRKEAYIQETPQEHLGYHLGFLCDNPTRIPKTLKRLQGLRQR